MFTEITDCVQCESIVKLQTMKRMNGVAANSVDEHSNVDTQHETIFACMLTNYPLADAFEKRYNHKLCCGKNHRIAQN